MLKLDNRIGNRFRWRHNLTPHPRLSFVVGEVALCPIRLTLVIVSYTEAVELFLTSSSSRPSYVVPTPSHTTRRWRSRLEKADPRLNNSTLFKRCYPKNTYTYLDVRRTNYKYVGITTMVIRLPTRKATPMKG